MKRSVLLIVALLIVSFFLVTAVRAQEKAKMATATGKVTAIDPEGKGITIVAKMGKDTMDVGIIVNQDTMVKVKGKNASLNEIRAGDTVTVRYEKSNDLYAKQIMKK